jgi:hypothetical protein
MTNAGDNGVLIITWKHVSDARIQNLISGIYTKNQDAIEGMVYREYDSIFSEEVGKVIPLLDEKAKEMDQKESRRERSLEAFC